MDNELWLPYMAPQNKDVGKVNQVGVYVPVDAVFPDITATEDTLKELLSTLSRTDSLLWCARLNLIVSNPSNDKHLNKQQYGIHNFFSRAEMRKLAKFMSEHKGPLTVFFRGQLLELMWWVCRYCKDLPGDGKTFNDSETRRTFAKAALVVSDLWGMQTYQDKMRLNEGIEAARRRSLGAVRIAYDATSGGLDPMMAIARGKSLFMDHFVRFHPPFADQFESATGIEPHDYFGLLCAIAIHYLDRTPEKVVESSDKSGIFLLRHFSEKNLHLAAISETYFAQASQTADELAKALWSDAEETDSNSLAWRDFRAVRERPILRTNDGRAIVLDPVFFAESASVGPLFKILPREKKKQGDILFTRFGHAFESYASSVLRQMYPSPKGVIADRLRCNLKGHDRDGNEVQIADQCLNNVNEIVLFETKATWIREDSVEHADPAEYLRVLRERYVRRSDDQPKGAGQLANAIANLATGEWEPSNDDLTAARKIYPVLLVCDARLDGTSHPHFLADEFRIALTPDETLPSQEMRKGRFVVAPLIVMTIDTLEILERSVEHFSLIDLLHEYSEASPDRMVSMHNFLAFSSFGKKLYASGSLAESALKVLDVAQELLGAQESISSQD